MKNPIKWVIIIVALIGAAAIVYYHWFREAPAPQPQPQPVQQPPAPVETKPVPETQPAPKIQYPVPETEKEKPLPTLGESDAAMREALEDLFGKRAFAKYFYLDEIIRRIVVTVDNLPRQKVSQRFIPVKPVAGRFRVTGEDENPVISPRNYSRYAPYVRSAEAVSVKKAVAVYVHFYPLFQQAYRDLGYPKGNFNDRLIEAIDNLLATPEVKGPVKLVQPGVLYQYADPNLEALSAGQKIMIRMGTENANRIKVKLREYRSELTHVELKQ
ncbi:MAG TPA: DUF3014 domain-containing protein [Burkholderiales bacterium]|nr:DUF3014 domain-containing protein [Burkholderiales bacterium]